MGHIAARAAVESWVLVPQLQAWQVPDEVTWDLGNLPAPMPLELHRNKVVVHWRPGLSAAWRTVPRSNHLQLAPRCGEIRLRAELRSRHAAVSDRAMLVVERSGRVPVSYTHLDVYKRQTHAHISMLVSRSGDCHLSVLTGWRPTS